MRILRISAIMAILISGVAQAGPDRLENMAERLSSMAEHLAADSYRGFRDRDRGSRADVEALYLVQQFSAGAALFRRMVEDRRPENELRDSLGILNQQIRNSHRFGFGQREWGEMSRTLDDMSRELGGMSDRWEDRRDRDDRGDRGPDRITGRMRWRGRVDDQVDLLVQGGSVSARVLTGGQVQTASANFTSSLPTHPVNVEVNKLRGRGEVQVIQQPSRDNGFTAVIRIRDQKGGADDYELEVVW